MKNYFCYLLIFISFLGYSCSGNKKNDSKNGEIDSTKTVTIDTNSIKKIDGIKIYPLVVNPNAEASISLNNSSNKIDRFHLNTLRFSLHDFALGKKGILKKSDSLKQNNLGQYIAFTVNNSQIKKLIKDSVQTQFLPGNNCVLAFLCSAYGISIKSAHSFYFHNFLLGQSQIQFKKGTACLFYNQPENGAHFSASQKVVLDFFLVNTKLSAAGYKVKATIDGVSFILTQWCPYVIEGLKPGKVRIRLELIDKDGNMANSPFNDSGQKIIYIDKPEV